MDVFWKVFSEFTEEDKRLYLKFVTGRGKLPLDIAKQNYPHTITVLGGNDATLPQAHICYNQIDLPKYTNEEVMRKRILTAVQFCGEVDTDGVRHADY
jgi:E3 ubiquitin-protein ligase HERC4